jgi:hypothetical protein
MNQEGCKLNPPDHLLMGGLKLDGERKLFKK